MAVKPFQVNVLLSIEIYTAPAYADAALFVHETVMLLEATFVAVNAVGAVNAVDIGTHERRVFDAGRVVTDPVELPLTVLKLLS